MDFQDFLAKNVSVRCTDRCKPV